MLKSEIDTGRDLLRSLEANKKNRVDIKVSELLVCYGPGPELSDKYRFYARPINTNPSSRGRKVVKDG